MELHYVSYKQEANTVSLAYGTLLAEEIVHWVGIIMVEFGPHQYAFGLLHALLLIWHNDASPLCLLKSSLAFPLNWGLTQ